jgi:rhodanese-related sulfurtransferase
MTHLRQHSTPRQRNGYAWLLAAFAAVLLIALPAVSACSSNSGGATATDVTTVGSGQAGGTTSSASAPVGVRGPGGVGTVVASTNGAGTYVDITPDELATMLKSKDFLFINVHIPYAGEIEKTDLFLPYDQAAQQIGRLPADKKAKIVVYCRSDRMSRISVNEWVKASYTNLYNLDGGFEAWVAAGYKLLQK